MHRFYDQGSGSKSFILQSANYIHQIVSVFRSKIGDSFIFFNGNDSIDFVYTVFSISKHEVQFQLIETIKKEEEKKKIHLFQALPNKHEKIEYILQKGVEVGLSSFTFFSSERSQKLHISDKKIERYKSIIVEAVEQSGRNTIPKIELSNKLSDVSPMGMKIYFHTSGNGKKISSFSSQNDEKIGKSISIFVGPEGGWSEQEEDFFTKKGFEEVSLGNNILRTETVSSVVGFYFLNYN